MKAVWTGLILTLMLTLVLATFGVPSSGRDFYIYWSAARAIQTGHSPYDLAILQAAQQGAGWDMAHEPIPFQPYLYPPWLAVLVWPLGWLPFRSALAIWLAANSVAMAAATLIWLRVAAQRIERSQLLIGLLVGLTYLPVLHLFVTAQISGLLCLSLALAVWSEARRHDRLAGISLGLLATKPQLGLIVAAAMGLNWWLQRRWSALRWLVITWIVCALVGFVLVPSWPIAMLAAQSQFEQMTGSAALANPADDPTVFSALRVGVQAVPALAVVVAIGLLVIGGLAIRWARSRCRPDARWWSAFGCVAVFILTPYTRAYDMALLIWPLIYVLAVRPIGWPWPLRYAIILTIYASPVVLALVKADGIWNVPIILGLAAVLLTPQAMTGGRVEGR